MSLDELRRSLEENIDRMLTPALIIDLDAVRHNAEAMVARTKSAHRWRPHLKTTKQSVIFQELFETGVRYFKVATLHELALLLDTAVSHDVVKDIDVHLAYPLHSNAALEGLKLLHAHHSQARITALADSPIHFQRLSQALPESVNLSWDLDLGMNRTGSPLAQWAKALREGKLNAKDLQRTSALHGYDGHLPWDAREKADAGYDALCALAHTVVAQRNASVPLHVVTSGTHSYRHALNHPGLQDGPWLSQVSPGTLVLSDLRSHAAAEDLNLRQAVFVASRVISEGTRRITLNAGSKAITPDGSPPSCALIGYSHITPLRASEEHLPCSVDAEASKPQLGELVLLIPSHACTTVNLYREVCWVRGPNIVGIGPIEAAGRELRLPSPKTPIIT